LIHRSFGHGAIPGDAVRATSAEIFVLFVRQVYCGKKQPAEMK